MARRWLATLDFYQTELDRTRFTSDSTSLAKDWAVSVARAKHRIVARQVTEAATEAALEDIVYLHVPTILLQDEFVTHGRFDWKKVTMMMPEYAVHGRRIARAVDRATFDPTTVLCKRRLMREFQSM